jgi:hypothetical protein
MSEQKKKTEKSVDKDKPKKPRLDPYKRSKVRDNDRHGRYDEDDTY